MKGMPKLKIKNILITYPNIYNTVVYSCNSIPEDWTQHLDMKISCLYFPNQYMVGVWIGVICSCILGDLDYEKAPSNKAGNIDSVGYRSQKLLSTTLDRQISAEYHTTKCHKNQDICSTSCFDGQHETFLPLFFFWYMHFTSIDMWIFQSFPLSINLPGHTMCMLVVVGRTWEINNQI